MLNYIFNYGRETPFSVIFQFGLDVWQCKRSVCYAISLVLISYYSIEFFRLNQTIVRVWADELQLISHSEVSLAKSCKLLPTLFEETDYKVNTKKCENLVFNANCIC